MKPHYAFVTTIVVFFALVSSAGASNGTAELAYQHENFSMIKIFDQPAQDMYENLRTPVVTSNKYPSTSKRSADGRMVCMKSYQGTIGVGTVSYECWIAFNSSDGSVIQTWKQ